MSQWIIIEGNPVDGFTHVGPFATHDDAVAYQEDKGGDWWVTELHWQHPEPTVAALPVPHERVCPRHGGRWGDDETCELCTHEDGTVRVSHEAPTYGWHGWEAETDLGNPDDREGVHYLTITEDGEELAVIIHRGQPVGPTARAKEVRARRIVDALNSLSLARTIYLGAGA